MNFKMQEAIAKYPDCLIFLKKKKKKKKKNPLDILQTFL